MRAGHEGEAEAATVACKGKARLARVGERQNSQERGESALERLSASDKKTLLIWILCALIGGGVAYKYFFRAFPEASIDFRVSRRAAVGLARQFATSQGADLAHHRSSIVFDVDDTAKTYLERELGLQQANQLMSSQVHTWYWSVRFFQPLQKEEFHVNLDPAGEIVGYEHVVADEAPGARLDQAAARAKAESFLRDTLHKDLSAYDYLPEEANSFEHPNRRDWSFTWERRGFRAKDAPYRMRVSLEGDCDRRVHGILESAGCVAARFRAPALEE